METLLAIFIKVLTIQASFLGCAPDCTIEQRAAFIGQLQEVQQDLSRYQAQQSVTLVRTENPAQQTNEQVVTTPKPKPMFTKNPEVVRDGNKVTITFETNESVTANVRIGQRYSDLLTDYPVHSVHTGQVFDIEMEQPDMALWWAVEIPVEGGSVSMQGRIPR